MDPGQLVNAQTTFNSLLKQVRDVVASPDLTHAQRESLRADAERAMGIASRAPQFQGRGVAMFACSQAGLYEELILPGPVRNRAVVDARPYLRPLLALAQADPRYAVVVVDTKQAWLYHFQLGRLEEASHHTGQGVRAHDFAGWHGLEEWSTHHRAEGWIRRHFRETAQAAEAGVGRLPALRSLPPCQRRMCSVPRVSRWCCYVHGFRDTSNPAGAREFHRDLHRWEPCRSSQVSVIYACAGSVAMATAGSASWLSRATARFPPIGPP